MKKLLIIDPALESESGHNHRFNTEISKFIARDTYELVVFANKNYSQSKTDLIHIKSVFTFSTYTFLDDNPILVEDETVEYSSEIFVHEINQVIHEMQICEFNIFIHTFSHIEILGLYKFMKRSNLKFNIYISLCNDSFYNYSRCEYSQAALLLKDYFNKIILDGYTIVPFAANQLLAVEMFFMTGINCTVHPLAGSKIVKTKKKTSKIVCSFLGSSRQEKGFSLLLDFLETIPEHYKDIEFHIQFLKNSEICNEDIDRIYIIIQQSKNVKIINKILTNAEYENQILASDILLLPYNPISYKVRTSGIFIDAILSSTPVIIPDHTWMSEIFKNYHVGGCKMNAFSLKEFVLAFNYLVANLQDETLKSKNASDKWLIKNNSTAMVTTILQ